MERVEGARTPYEVYCFHCRVTFPAEARRCLHCGGPLFGAGERAAAAAPIAPIARLPIPAQDEEEGPLMAVRRFGGLAIWAIVALSAVLSNLCHRGPG
ncbi:MAG: hypothetical protein E6J87_07425 [Deltaproteobacteria bacterium]|nr:MAG: hypothetical protein E6J87_07425 [Deltaproteobacteria bacterium]